MKPCKASTNNFFLSSSYGDLKSSIDSLVLSFSKYGALDPDCKFPGFLLSLNHKKNQKSG